MIKKAAALLLFLSLLFVAVAVAEETSKGRISGKMMIQNGGPMSKGAVFIYSARLPKPLPEKYFRVPDIVSVLDEEGSFSVEITPGTYYIGGIKKESTQGPGPLKEGDYFFISQEPGGQPRAYIVNGNETLDIGTVSEAVPYNGLIEKEGVTAIQGKVLNVQGKPAEGVIVFADVTPAGDMGISFVSNWTGKDGKYFVRVHEGGTYNLSATDFIDARGIYGDETAGPVSVKTGEVLDGIDLKIEKNGK